MSDSARDLLVRGIAAAKAEEKELASTCNGYCVPMPTASRRSRPGYG
jgi:hypothetical protein